MARRFFIVQAACGTSVPLRLSMTVVFLTCRRYLRAQLSLMSSLGLGRGDADGVPRGSWHGLCGHSSDTQLALPHQHAAESTDEKLTGKEIRSRKLCQLAAAAARKILLQPR